MTRVVVLVSGAGSNLAALLAAHGDDAYGARVVGVVSDKAAAGGLEIARAAGIPTAVVAPADFEDRAAWDRALARSVSVAAGSLKSPQVAAASSPNRAPVSSKAAHIGVWGIVGRRLPFLTLAARWSCLPFLAMAA